MKKKESDKESDELDLWNVMILICLKYLDQLSSSKCSVQNALLY